VLHQIARSGGRSLSACFPCRARENSGGPAVEAGAPGPAWRAPLTGASEQNHHIRPAGCGNESGLETNLVLLEMLPVERLLEEIRAFVAHKVAEGFDGDEQITDQALALFVSGEAYNPSYFSFSTQEEGKG
jgi:hypothetical protein